MFKPEKYTPPKFDREPFISFPDVTTEKAGDGYIPENFYATTIYPEYFKINGEWKMLTGSRMDCSVVIKDGMPFRRERRPSLKMLLLIQMMPQHHETSVIK